MEYTGESYRCTKCYHTWDYEDDRCPECGSMYMEDFYKEKPMELKLLYQKRDTLEAAKNKIEKQIKSFISKQ